MTVVLTTDDLCAIPIGTDDVDTEGNGDDETPALQGARSNDG